MNEKERARELFLEGYNCSQAVFIPFCHRFDIDEEAAKKFSAGLGGGLGRQREVCGSVSAAAMVLGSLCCATEGADQESKRKNYELVREFCSRFTERHGAFICRDILKITAGKKESAVPDERTPEYYKKRPCLRVIESAAEILQDMIKEYEDGKLLK